MPAPDPVDLALPLIKEFEGFKARPYLCPTGFPTIGYGNRFYEDGREVRLVDPAINEARATHLARFILYDCVAQIDRRAASPLNPFQTAALASFLFNVGPGGPRKDGLFSLRNGNPSTLWRHIQNGNYAAAAEQFPLWTKGTVNGVFQDLPGLVRRRRAERALFERKV